MSSWIEGTATRSTFRDWYGVGATRPHAEPWPKQSDHPTLGHGHGPTPHEHVLHALAACLTLGIATTAAARKIELTKIESTVEGDIDVRGLLGVDPEVRNGFSQIRATFVVEGDADRESARRAGRGLVPPFSHLRHAREPDTGRRHHGLLMMIHC